MLQTLIFEINQTGFKHLKFYLYYNQNKKCQHRQLVFVGLWSDASPINTSTQSKVLEQSHTHTQKLAAVNVSNSE